LRLASLAWQTLVNYRGQKSLYSRFQALCNEKKVQSREADKRYSLASLHQVYRHPSTPLVWGAIDFYVGLMTHTNS